MQAFSLDHENGIPVKIQLKAHIRYQIMTGLLRPGDQLPPLRDLAAGLNINLNTVVRAVSELEAEGFLYRHQGKGVFVSERFPGEGHGAALRSLLAGVMQASRDWSISAEEMALSLMAHAQLARPPQSVPHRVLLVGGSRLQLRRLQGELEAALPAVVQTVLPEDLPDRTRASDYRVVASTLFHTADAVRFAPRALVLPLAPRAQADTFARLSELPAGTRVAVAAQDWVHGARVRKSLELAGLSHLDLDLAIGRTPVALAPHLASAALVLATADCRDIAREALPEGRATTFVAEPVEVPQEVLEAMRQALGAPSPEARVHVRSAWV